MKPNSAKARALVVVLGAGAVLGLIVGQPQYWLLAALGVGVGGLVLTAILRPRWALLGLIAFPPGVLSLLTSSTGMTVYVMLAITALGVAAVIFGRRRLGNPWLAGGYAWMLSLMTLSYARGQVSNAVGSKTLLVTLYSYAALYLLVINLAPEGREEREAFAERIQVAVLVSVLATGVIAIFQLGSGFLSTFSVRLFPENAGFLFTRTHFGYLMSLGFAVALPRWVGVKRHRTVWAALGIASSMFVILSMTRGGWFSALVVLAIVALNSNRAALLIAVPVTGLLSQLPAIKSRLTSDLAGGALLAIQSGAAGSHRVLLWMVLLGVALQAPLMGHGFGYLSSLSAEAYFGEAQFTTSVNQSLYAHNDALYLLLEIGLIGLVPYLVGLVGWWFGLVRVVRHHWRRGDSPVARIALTCLGVAIVTLVAQSVDNGFFMKAVFERFAVVAATLVLVMDQGDDAAVEGPVHIAA